MACFAPETKFEYESDEAGAAGAIHMLVHLAAPHCILPLTSATETDSLDDSAGSQIMMEDTSLLPQALHTAIISVQAVSSCKDKQD